MRHLLWLELLRLRRSPFVAVFMIFAAVMPFYMPLTQLFDRGTAWPIGTPEIAQGALFVFVVCMALSSSASDGYVLAHAGTRRRLFLARVLVLAAIVTVPVGAVTLVLAGKGEISAHSAITIARPTDEAALQKLPLTDESIADEAYWRERAARDPEAANLHRYVDIKAPWLRAREVVIVILALWFGAFAGLVMGPRNSPPRKWEWGSGATWLPAVLLWAAAMAPFGDRKLFLNAHFAQLVGGLLLLIGVYLVLGYRRWQRADVR